MNYKIKNYMEDAVREKVMSYLKKSNSCSCERCVLDIMALALNELPAKYYVTEIGELFIKTSELASQYNVDLEVAVLKAIALVKANPRH